MIDILSNPSYFLPPLISVAIILALLFVALLLSRRDFSTWLFCAVLGSMILQSLIIFGMRASPDANQALLWHRAVSVPTMAIFVFYYHFTLVYTNNRGQRYILRAYYFLLVLVACLVPTDLITKEMRVETYGYTPIIGLGSYTLLAMGFPLLFAAAYNLLKRYRASPFYEERRRHFYLIAAVLFPLAGAILDGFTNLPPSTIWGNLIFSIICTFAILRYHLFDIRIFMRKSLVYILVSAIIAVPYAAVLVIVNYLFTPTIEIWWVHALLILFLAIILRPLYGWAQSLVDRIFYRDRYNYLRELERFSQETHSITDLMELSSNMVQLISGALRSSNACLLLPSKENSGWFVASCARLDTPPSEAILTSQSPLVRWLKLHGRILSSVEIDVIPQLQSLSSIEKQNLKNLGAKLYIPIKTRDGELSGILILGEKLGQLVYSTEDIQLLKTLSNQMAMTFENAQLYTRTLQAQEDLKTWLNGMTDCVMITDAYSTIQFANKATLDKFGSRVGEKCWEVIGRDTECPDCPVENYVQGNREGQHYIRNIGDREYDIATAPLLNPDGSLSIIEVLRDITERKQLEEELQRVERLESVGTLAGGIAHDFNNLLTGIIGNIGLARRYLKPRSKAETRLLEAEKVSLRARDLTQQLLTFARGGAPIREVISIRELIKDTTNFALSGSSVVSRFSLLNNLWPVEVDQGQIVQAINNLIINADEAMPDGGTLNVTAENILIDEGSTLPIKKGKYVKITVEDQGTGISEEHLNRILEPYFTTKENGSGLGLTTAYSIIKKHDGCITIKSRLGSGTTCYIYLPASERPLRMERKVIPELCSAGKGRILVMDDEEAISDLLYYDLTDVGYEVELTTDGAEAIKRYTQAKKSRRPFDAVILDLTVRGGIGGKETIKRLLEIDSNVKVIVSSGYATDPIMAEFQERGFKGVIAKPYKIEELEKKLHSIITQTDE